MVSGVNRANSASSDALYDGGDRGLKRERSNRGSRERLPSRTISARGRGCRRVVAVDLGDLGLRVPHDAPGEGEEAREVRREGAAHGGEHRVEAGGGGGVDGDEEDGEVAQDEVEIGYGEHGGEARRRQRGPDQRPGGDVEVEAPRRHFGDVEVQRVAAGIYDGDGG